MGVGSILQEYLARKRWFWRPYEDSTCGACNALAEEMDQAGPVAVRQQIENYTDRMVDSSRHWMRERGGVWVPLERAPRRPVLRRLILWACDVAEAA